MRGLTNPESVARFMRALGERTAEDARVYFTGGVTALLFGWRETTIDIDLQLVPDRDDLLRAIAALKDEPSLLSAGLVEPARLRQLFDSVVDQLYRYPAIDPKTLVRAVEEALAPPL